MYDNQVTRMQFGLNNTRDTETFSDLPCPDYMKWHDYFEDFDYYNGPVAVGTTNGYTLTGTGATITFAAADGGSINLIGATTGFIAALQRATGTFKIETGKRLWYGALLTLSTLASATQLIAGLTNVTGTPFTGGQITDGVWFSSDAGGTGILSINVAVGGVVTTVALGNLIVAAAQMTLKWYWDAGIYAAAPNGRIVWEASGPGVSTNLRGSVPAPANFPGATLLAPQLAVKGTAGTPTITADLVFALKERINQLATPTF